MSTSLSHWKPQIKSALFRSATLQDMFSESRIEAHCRTAGHTWRQSFWSPSITVLTCILQTLSAVKSLRAAVADLLCQHVRQDGETTLPSADPSAFAQARRRVPLAALQAVLDEVTQQVRTLAHADEDRWHGRRVMLIDGSTFSMPDTPELQQAFPQPVRQKPGCGFPVASVVGVFCWHSGALLQHAVGSRHDSEFALFRSMLESFGPGTVAVADRYYCSYVNIARLTARGADVVFRMHQRRSADFRQGTRLGPHDRLVTWERPKLWLPSCGLSREEFEHLPATLTLRMIRTSRAVKGFRSQEIIIVTSVLDPQKVSADELLTLYRDRWMVELNLRSLKITLDMDILRGKSADVVRKELLAHLIVYNLIRLLMWEAAQAAGRDPHRLSFAGTLHRLQRVAGELLLSESPWPEQPTMIALRHWIGCDVVPQSRDTFQPRRVKRRPKQYSHLTLPRAHYRRHGDPSCR